jgi:hypothetical protein
MGPTSGNMTVVAHLFGRLQFQTGIVHLFCVVDLGTTICEQ